MKFDDVQSTDWIEKYLSPKKMIQGMRLVPVTLFYQNNVLVSTFKGEPEFV